MTNTQEFLEVRLAFEAFVRQTPRIRGEVTREGDIYGRHTPANGEWYTNGEINAAFHAFLAGWSAGRSYERQEPTQ
jgi:hypothetical protein